MYVRNLLRAGDYIELVPVGIPITLVYNHHLDRVKLGFSDTSEDITDTVLSTFRNNSTVPAKIPVIQGTTWVKGVLYTSGLEHTEGSIPECIQKELLLKYIENPKSFNFFAGHVESLGTVFKGALAIRQWLQTSKFNILPGFIVPSNTTKKSFYDTVSAINFPFRFPLVSHYIIYHKDTCQIHSTGIKQYVCKSVSKYIDENGYLKSKIKCQNAILDKHYTDIVRHNIKKDSLIVVDMYGDIIFTEHLTSESLVSKSVTCPACNKTYRVPSEGECSCDDIQCISHAYKKIKQFTTIQNLPCLTFDDFQSYVKNGDVISFTDLFGVEPLQGLEIKTTINKFLRAIIPDEVVHSSEIISQLCNKCNNSWKVLSYYMSNPERIITEFFMVTPDARRLVDYFVDPGNVSDIITLVESGQIIFIETERRFDGPPIFRNKTILLTGKFKHGAYSEVASILQSYGAKVIYDFSESASCLIIGDIKENVNGQIVRNCRNLHIPVFDENQFFNEYEIDKDLQLNLS